MLGTTVHNLKMLGTTVRNFKMLGATVQRGPLSLVRSIEELLE